MLNVSLSLSCYNLAQADRTSAAHDFGEDWQVRVWRDAPTNANKLKQFDRFAGYDKKTRISGRARFDYRLTDINH
jgi:hypothetical protein